MKQHALFEGWRLPLLIALPQLLLICLFFYWPALKAIAWSVHLVRPFGNGEVFVGLDNYARIVTDWAFWESIRSTASFAVLGVSMSVGISLGLAGLSEYLLGDSAIYRNLVMWPYAVAGAVVGIILKFVMNPVVGPMSVINEIWPGAWLPNQHPWEALLFVATAFAWMQMPFCFVILTAALRAIPDDYLAAAAMDGAGPTRRFIDIQVPMIAPQIVFVIVICTLDSLTHSFGLIDSLTRGGPAGATTILPYKIYADGFLGLDLSGSSALSVILMVIIVSVTIVQSMLANRQKQPGGRHA